MNFFQKCWMFEIWETLSKRQLWSCVIMHSKSFPFAFGSQQEFTWISMWQEEKKRRRRTRLSASASKVIGLWPIWPGGPSNPTQPIQAQTSCGAAGRRGGLTADYNQRQGDFIKCTTSLHVFGGIRDLVYVLKNKASTGNIWISSFSSNFSLSWTIWMDTFHHRLQP